MWGWAIAWGPHTPGTRGLPDACMARSSAAACTPTITSIPSTVAIRHTTMPIGRVRHQYECHRHSAWCHQRCAVRGCCAALPARVCSPVPTQQGTRTWYTRMILPAPVCSPVPNSRWRVCSCAGSDSSPLQPSPPTHCVPHSSFTTEVYGAHSAIPSLEIGTLTHARAARHLAMLGYFGCTQQAPAEAAPGSMLEQQGFGLSPVTRVPTWMSGPAPAQPHGARPAEKLPQRQLVESTSSDSTEATQSLCVALECEKPLNGVFHGPSALEFGLECRR